MRAFFAIVFALSAIAVLPAFLASIYTTHKLNRHLQATHPDIWTRISPPRGTEPSLSSPSVRFITQRKYLQVGDPMLRLLGDRAYRLLYLAGAVFLILVLSGLAIAQ